MERDGKHRNEDREHGRRWRRDPFTPAKLDRPRGVGGSSVREPRDPRPRGGSDPASDPAPGSERPPSG